MVEQYAVRQFAERRSMMRHTLARRLVLATVLVSAITGTAAAGRLSEVTPIGFSPDGDYYAYVLSGVDDMSGFPFARLFVVDVPANEFVVERAVLPREGDFKEIPTQEAVASQVIYEASDAMNEYGIERGLFGETVLYQDPDVRPDVTKLDGERSITVQRFAFVEETYRIQITQRPYPSDRCAMFMGEDSDPVIFTCTLYESDGTPHVLQEDTTLYESRWCPFAYGLHRVYAYAGNIVIFLHSLSAVIEGPDYNKVVVTGSLPYRDVDRTF